MSSPAQDIHDYLVANGFGTSGTDLFYHHQPSKNILSVTVRDSGGFDPDKTLDKSESISRPTIQIFGRGKKYGFDEIYSKLEDIVEFLDQTHEIIINSKRYISIFVSGGILDLGEDTSEQPELSVNFMLELVLVPAISYLYQNDFTNDPLGDYDPINSDVLIAPTVVEHYATFGGVVTANGYQGKAPSPHLGIELVKNLPLLTTAEFECRFFADTEGAKTGINLGETDGNLASNIAPMVFVIDNGSLLISSFAGDYSEPFVAAPSSNWLGKLLKGEITNTGNSFTVKAYVDGALTTTFTRDISASPAVGTEASFITGGDAGAIEYIGIKE